MLHPIHARSLLAVWAACFTVCVSVLASGCNQATEKPTRLSRPPLRDDGGEVRTLITDRTNEERVSDKNERGIFWRDAVRMERGIQHTFQFSEMKPDDILRIGLREAEEASAAPISIDMRWENGHSEQRTSDGSAGWQDFTIGGDGGEQHGENGTVTLSSDSGFWLSHFELVPYSRQSPHVIIVLIDTLRQDHLHCYGYERETSPNIDAFREDAVLFTGLVPPTSWTRPSVASLLTSTYPGVNGVRDRGDRVREDVTWLADVLEAQAYESHAILTNPNCIPTWGFGEESDRTFEAHPNRWRYEDTDAEAVGISIDAARELRHRPFFMYLHAMAPHSPYDPPESFLDAVLGGKRSVLSPPIDRYDAEIAYFDSLFGEFMATLKQEGTYDSSLIVVLSDHGEEFLEHGGTMHGHSLYEELLRVPLLIKFPENAFAGTSWNGLLEMVDVAPTILDILDMSSPSTFQGSPILPHLNGGGETKTIGYAELHLGKQSMRSTKTLHMKYIDNIAKRTELYFDLRSDPGELRPLSEMSAEAAAIKLEADKIAMLGNSGLHILITHDSARTETIRAVVRSGSLGDASMRYPESLYELTYEDKSHAVFTAIFPAATNPSVPSAHWQEAIRKNESLRRTVENASPAAILSEQNHAEIVLDLPLDAHVQLELFIGDEPFPSERIRLGPEDRADAHSWDGGPLDVAGLIASPVAYDPAALPVGTAAYIWYVPGRETIADKDMDPELRESLEALGYISE